MTFYSFLRKGNKLVQKHIAKWVSPEQLFAASGQRRELPSFTGRLVSQKMNSWQALFSLFDETFWLIVLSLAQVPIQSGNFSQRKDKWVPRRKAGNRESKSCFHKYRIPSSTLPPKKMAYLENDSFSHYPSEPSWQHVVFLFQGYYITCLMVAGWPVSFKTTSIPLWPWSHHGVFAGLPEFFNSNLP